MAISYNRLWKRLIDHDLSKTDMMRRANISTNVLARLGKGAPVSMGLILYTAFGGNTSSLVESSLI